MALSTQSRDLMESLTQNVKRDFKEKNYICSFEEYLEVLFKNPKRLTRNAAEYFKDMIEYFGVAEESGEDNLKTRRYRLFERQRSKSKPAIIGQADAHEQIYRVIEQFVRQGRVDKLILLHGPNGSSKSSTAEALAFALEEYSKTDEGAVYRFNWIFPNDKAGFEGLSDTNHGKHIGFGDAAAGRNAKNSFAHLIEDEILCKIISELKENPVFLLPRKERIQLYLQSMEKHTGRKLSVEDIPQHIEDGALGAKSKLIFDALLVAYQGDLERVLKHVQVERFFFSSRYRVGISTVEPQMNIDAQEKQITMDRSIQNIPPVLQNMRIFEPGGDLVDANRGFIEFADLLKRPLEAFKYLLTTIEKMSINMTSGAADLDLIMLASTNEKHLDAFKASPDWPSFKGRFELIRVPYLLSSKLERQIYEEDVRIIRRTKPIGPHAVELLAKWAVLTRLRQPDPEYYDFPLRGLVARLDPYEKLSIYDEEPLGNNFTEAERSNLKKLTHEIRRESQMSVAYEGRFGASPREMKMLLYFASQNSEYDSVSVLAVFEEIEKLTRDRTVYDYLQFEPRNGYHDYKEFSKFIKASYTRFFNREFLAALNLFDEDQFVPSFQNYLRHVVAFIKNERLENDHTGKMEDPNETVMSEMESLMGFSGNKRDVREHLVAKIASWRVETTGGQLDIAKVYALELQTIARRIYENKEEFIKRVKEGMLMWGSADYDKLPADLRAPCEDTYRNLESRFGYTRRTSWQSLVFLRTVAI